MIVIPLVIVLTLFGYYKSKFIRKHNTKLYIISTILAILSFFFRNKVPFTEPFTQGYIGLSNLYIVMFIGALNNKSKLRVKIMGVRREYSIIGFILITPHALKYFFKFLNGSIPFEWFGVIPYLIMLPLFITSFIIIRKKLSHNAWKNIQKWAYLAYILIFIHLILVAKTPNLFVYIILFTPYLILKLVKELKLMILTKKRE